jgi:hypothetical protein
MTISNEIITYGNLKQTKNPFVPYKCIYGKTAQTNWRNNVEKTYFLYNRLVFSLLHGKNVILETLSTTFNILSLNTEIKCVPLLPFFTVWGIQPS